MQDINGYEGRYAVTEDGRVWRHARVSTFVQSGRVRSRRLPGKWLSPGIRTDGYPFVNVTDGTIPRSLPIHRLVAQAFVPNPNGRTEVNHIDGDKLNNSVVNLEWVTHSENMIHAWASGLRN